MISQIIRKLKIYHLTDMGDSTTIELSQWINDTFKDLIIFDKVDGNLYYYSKNKINIIVQDIEAKRIWIQHSLIWDVFETRYNLTYNQTQTIIKYIMYKYYGLENYTPNLGNI